MYIVARKAVVRFHQGLFEVLGGIFHADAMANPHACQSKRNVKNGEHLCKQDIIRIQMAHCGAQADRIVQHDAFIDEEYAAGADQQPQEPLISVEGVCHCKQE